MGYSYMKEGDALAPRGQAFIVEDENIETWLKRLPDGTDIEVPEGMTVMEARRKAEAEGVYFKYHHIQKDEYDELCKK